MHTTVSSKEIQKARRLAKRTRSAVACARCKVSKVKCNDYRPCKQCVENLRSCDNGTFRYSMKKDVARKAEYDRRISGSSSLSTQSQALDYSKEIGIIPQRFDLPETALSKTHPNLLGAADFVHVYSDAVDRVLQSVPLGPSSGCPFLTSIPQNQYSTQFSPQLKLDVPLNPPFFLPSIPSWPSPAFSHLAALLHGSSPSAPLLGLQPSITGILLGASSAAPPHLTAAAFLPRF